LSAAGGLKAVLFPDASAYLFSQTGEAQVEGDDDTDDGGAEDAMPAMSFEKEVEDIVGRGVEEGVNPDNIAMEVNGRKFAHDKSFGDCAVVMFPTMLNTLPTAESRKEAFSVLRVYSMCVCARHVCMCKACVCVCV
jgi:hypothetical protein